MKNSDSASSREAAGRNRERVGRKCVRCGATHGAMITMGVHVGEPKDKLTQPEPAWLDHWNGAVRARDDGRVLPGGRFIGTQRPAQVVVKNAHAQGANLASELCQWHLHVPETAGE